MPKPSGIEPGPETQFLVPLMKPVKQMKMFPKLRLGPHSPALLPPRQ
jgi:hypothetical protein